MQTKMLTELWEYTMGKFSVFGKICKVYEIVSYHEHKEQKWKKVEQRSKVAESGKDWFYHSCIVLYIYLGTYSMYIPLF